MSLTHYNVAASICGKIYKEVKERIVKEFEVDDTINILPLLEYADVRAKEELNVVFKKKSKGVAYPLTINKNNMVSNYRYDYIDKNNEMNFIKRGDLLKISIGIDMLECVAYLTESFCVSRDPKDHPKDHPDYEKIEFLDKLQQKILDKIKPGEISDTIKQLIESKCTNKDVFPIENCLIKHHNDPEYEPKDTFLNYKKIYDGCDELLTPPNYCYEYEEGDVYTFDTSITDNVDDENKTTYKKINETHLYKFNDNYYSLKLKSSKEFYNIYKKLYNCNVFELTNNHIQSDIYGSIESGLLSRQVQYGKKECITHDILKELPIIVCNKNVVIKKFTIIVTKDSCRLLKYN